ncbi:hypothetical protein HYPSUDRAFT_42131 [Hypholoma sublateritium FD-334 SS-4]|uniref:Uncharacterized protein n=1 Tax=Hypholoma sublateritium (strain FD-334 SS-4) TaxID=945553 RepID=A0A0D2L3E5_HYPSF|nr:hypothetical protein HYPSUDRAFT_42131 [Hypholoma sublateritium FD-334 SS-4]
MARAMFSRLSLRVFQLIEEIGRASAQIFSFLIFPIALVCAHVLFVLHALVNLQAVSMLFILVLGLHTL